jgi:hypothetical protein
MRALGKWLAGVIGGIVATIIGFHLTEGNFATHSRPAPTPNTNWPSTPPGPSTPNPRQVAIEAKVSPKWIKSGCETSIQVELRSELVSISNADVTIVVETGEGAFKSSGSNKISGTTDARGFFSAVWSPLGEPPSGFRYYFNVTATKPGYERATKLLRVSVE